MLAHPGRYKVSDERHAPPARRISRRRRRRDRGAVLVAHAGAVRASTRRYARVFGLAGSCGSDYHGPGESWMDLGDLPRAAGGRRAGVEGLVVRRMRGAAAAVGPRGDRPLMPRRCPIAAPSSSSPTAPASPPRCSATACCRSSRSSSSSGRRFRSSTRRRRSTRSIRQINETATREGTAADRVQLDRRRGDERDDPARRATR